MKITTDEFQNLLENPKNIRHVMISHNGLETEENPIIKMLTQKSSIEVEVTECDLVSWESRFGCYALRIHIKLFIY